MNDIITGNPSGKIDEKRFYLPGVVVSGECPKCGEVSMTDLGFDYLDYPPMNQPFEMHRHCRECDEEWYISVKLNVSLELMENQS